MNDDLRLRIAAQRTALHELNATSATLRAFAEQVVTTTREIMAGIALRRECERGQWSVSTGPPAMPIAPADDGCRSPATSCTAPEPGATLEQGRFVPRQRQQ
jgi:hypothetical protein